MEMNNKKKFDTQTQNHARHDKTIYGIAKENRITCEICFMVQSLKLSICILVSKLFVLERLFRLKFYIILSENSSREILVSSRRVELFLKNSCLMFYYR